MALAVDGRPNCELSTAVFQLGTSRDSACWWNRIAGPDSPRTCAPTTRSTKTAGAHNRVPPRCPPLPRLRRRVRRGFRCLPSGAACTDTSVASPYAPVTPVPPPPAHKRTGRQPAASGDLVGQRPPFERRALPAVEQRAAMYPTPTNTASAESTGASGRSLKGRAPRSGPASSARSPRSSGRFPANGAQRGVVERPRVRILRRRRQPIVQPRRNCICPASRVELPFDVIYAYPGRHDGHGFTAPAGYVFAGTPVPRACL